MKGNHSAKKEFNFISVLKIIIVLAIIGAIAFGIVMLVMNYTNKAKIENEISTVIDTSFTALKNLDNSEHKFIKMCVQNSRLASKYDERINLYIKNEKDVEKLKSIAAVAPHDIVIKIVQNMRGNRERLTDKLIKNHEVDFNTKVLLEKYTAEHAA